MASSIWAGVAPGGAEPGGGPRPGLATDEADWADGTPFAAEVGEPRRGRRRVAQRVKGQRQKVEGHSGVFLPAEGIMDANGAADVGGNLDRRLARIEQILPTLATKDDLRPLTTKEELKALATKEELKALATKEELREAVAKLATKEELREEVAKLATREELREEGERSRRYMKILVEELKDRIDLYAERLTTVDDRDVRQHTESVEADRALGQRVTAIEAASRRRRQ